MTETQNIPWRRHSIEAAAIVGSILLAFSIDAWWEERGLRVEEQQVLQGLRSEFHYISDVLSGHMSEHLQHLQTLENFLDAAGNGGVEEARPIVIATLLVLLTPMTSDLGSGSLDALIGSGRIEILTNRTLRAKLAAWKGVIGEVWDDQALNVKAVFEIHIPYFLAENIPAGAAMRQWYEESPSPLRPPFDDPDMVSRLLSDEKLRAMVEIRYAYKRHTKNEFEIAVAAVNEILAEIDSSIH
jgi:hypothetical protein